MAVSQDSTSEDQLYALMCSVISLRKKCPKILSQLEEERVTLMLKRLDEAKIEPSDDNCTKEIEAIHANIKNLLNKIPPESSIKLTEAQYEKSRLNMEKVKEFLELRARR